MTILQDRLAKAKSRLEDAYIKERQIWTVCDLKRMVAERKAMKPYHAARAKTRKERAAFTNAGLAALHISPMKTIVTRDRKSYVVSVKHDGYAELLRVKKDDTLFKDATFYSDHIGRLDRLIITDRVLK